MADACDAASSAVSSCANAWAEAVAEWKRAQGLAKAALADEAAHRSTAAKAVAATTPAQQAADPTSFLQAQSAASGADGYTSPDRSRARQVGEDAVTKANRAINTAADHLGKATAVAHMAASAPSAADDGFDDKFLLFDGAPSAPLTAVGAYGQVSAWVKDYQFLKAFDDHDFSALAKADPEAYASVEKVIKADPDDLGAINNAWFRYLEDTSSDLSSEMARAAVPIDGMDGASGVLGTTFDVLGKVALPLAAAGDVVTLVDPKTTGLEKGMSAANLAGVGMAAAGTDVGESGLALVGLVNGVGDTIPVVGEVIMAGTAAYLAYDYIHANWKTIKQWAGDAGSVIAGGYDDLSNVSGALLGDAGHLTDSALHDAGHLASGAVHEGKKLLGDIGL